MKKILIYTLSIFLLTILGLSNSYSNNNENEGHQLYGKVYFKIKGSQVDPVNKKIDELLGFTCEDSNGDEEKNIIFTCSKDLYKGITGCGIRLTDYVYEKKYNCSLFLKSSGKTAPLKFYVRDSISIIKKVNPYDGVDMSNFPKNIDITNSFYKRSLQNKMLSCESSATSDILSTLLKRKVDEDEVIRKLDKDWYQKRSVYKNGKRMWGNPNKGFVGYIDKNDKGVDAQQYNYDGYGVLEKPIAKVYNSYGFNTHIITENDHDVEYTPKDHMFDLLGAINSGNYVQLWGDWCTNPKLDDGKYKTITDSQANSGKTGKNTCFVDYRKSRKVIWYYENDKGEVIQHTGLNGEHAFYLLGYKGSYENPTHIIVWDTYSGKHTYPYSEWMRKWGKMQYRSIVISK